MKICRLIAATITTVYLLYFVPAASAHRPEWGDPSGVTEIPEIQTSRAYYRELETREKVDAYVFQAQAGDHLHAGINIPAIAGLEDYDVTVALLGPGLPEADPDSLPDSLPERLGAVVFGSTPGKDFYEPFTQTSYWGRQQIEVDLPATGTYYLLVWNPSDKTGKYVLDVGELEAFGLADLLRFPLWWVRIRLFFGQWPLVVGLAGVPVATVILFMILKKK